jgi:hypothetical protein
MTLRIDVNDEQLLDDLMAALARHGCLTNRVGPATLRVVCPRARDAREAQLEVRFFVRAWQARHPNVEAVLTP